MENRPFLSVVMPIYNVEKYLNKAIDSVLSQNFFDLEIILVNDASPDNCDEICRAFDERYDFIKYVKHTENKGLSESRNTGIKNAVGKYIYFFDPDDYIEETLFETVFNTVFERDFEVVVFGLKENYYDKSDNIIKTVEIRPENRFITEKKALGEEILKLEKATLYGYAWNKFYLLDVINSNNLLYENIPLIEDIKFNVQYFNCISTAALLDISPYHYAKRENQSITNKFQERYFEVHYQRINLLLNQAKDFGVADEKNKNTIANIFVRYIFSALSRNFDKRSKLNKAKRKEFLLNLYNDALFLELIPFAAANARTLKIMIKLLKAKSVKRTLLLAKSIYISQSKAKSLFVKLKQTRE